MAGNTISLFPIMMVGMMFVRPVQSIFSYKDGRSTSILNQYNIACHHEYTLRQVLKRYPHFLLSFLFSSVPQTTGGPGRVAEGGIRFG